MRIGRSKLARILMVGAVLMALTMPGTIVFARDGGGHGGHDADGGHHDAANGGHGDVDKGGGGTAGGGNHVETSSPDAGRNGDTMGDLKSNMHTGAKGRGAGGDDKFELGAGTTGVTTAGAPAHAAAVTESPRSGAVGATPGAAGIEAAHSPASVGTAGAPGGAVAPGTTAAAPPSVPVLGSEQTAIGPTTPGQRMVLGAQQTGPRTLPFTGLSAAWAMLISGGRWAGVLLGLLGLTFLVRGLRRA